MEQKNDGPRRRWWVLDLQQCINAPFILERIGVWTSPESDWDEGYSKNAEQRDVEVILRDKRSGTPVSLGDVGVGISQVIPVLVAARDQSLPIAYIEQPELHLHPKQQAMLGDVFAQTIRTARWYEPREGVQSQERTILVETHSELLLLRILRRICETKDGIGSELTPKIQAKDVRVYAVENDIGGTVFRVMPISQAGQFVGNWPKGFFDERLDEVL